MLFTFCSPGSSDVFTENFVTLYMYIYIYVVVHQAVQMFSLSTLSLFICIYIYMLFTFCSPGSSDVFTEHFVTLYIYIYICCSPFVHQAVQMFSMSTLSLYCKYNVCLEMWNMCCHVLEWGSSEQGSSKRGFW